MGKGVASTKVFDPSRYGLKSLLVMDDGEHAAVLVSHSIDGDSMQDDGEGLHMLRLKKGTLLREGFTPSKTKDSSGNLAPGVLCVRNGVVTERKRPGRHIKPEQALAEGFTAEMLEQGSHPDSLGLQQEDLAALSDGNSLISLWGYFIEKPLLVLDHKGAKSVVPVPPKAAYGFARAIETAGENVAVHCSHFHDAVYTAKYRNGVFFNWRARDGGRGAHTLWHLNKQGLWSLTGDGLKLEPDIKVTEMEF